MRLLVLDSHVLLLLVVGTSASSNIEKHRRLQAYSETDYTLLTGVLERFDRIAVTPNVLTETSNLLGYIHEPLRTQLFRLFRAMIDSFDESFVESKVSSRRDEFLRLGLTDATLLHKCEHDVTLLTADLDLYLAALASKCAVLNFTHLREAAGAV